MTWSKRSAVASWFVVCSLALAPGVSNAAPGDLDPSFGTGGMVATSVGAYAEAFAVAVQPDGKIVAAGHTLRTWDRFALVRYRSNGWLDRSFGDKGRVRTFFRAAPDFNGDSEARAVAIQPDGKIVAAGYVQRLGANNNFAIARYMPDGSLDRSFGRNGRVQTSFGTEDQACCVAILPHGRILVAGFTFSYPNSAFAVARYMHDGSLDPSFGTNGRVTTSFGGHGFGYGLAVQSDRRFIVVGDDGGSDFFAVARYLANGALDSSFGSGGQVTTAVDVYSAANSVAVQPDGKIVVGGGSWDGLNGDFSLVRYMPDGSLDPSFGTGGEVTTSSSRARSGIGSIVLQPDGHILAGGSTCDSQCEFALARYNSDGSLDTSFGVGGQVATPLGGSCEISALALTGKGTKTIAVGDVMLSTREFALARYTLT